MVIDPHPLMALFGERSGNCEWPLKMRNAVAFYLPVAK